MIAIKNIRQQTGLSQSQLADYLGVSKSLVNLAEKGLRNLHGEPAIKLSHLQLQLQNNQISGEKISDKKYHEAAQKRLSKHISLHKRKTEDHRYKASILKYKLGKMITAWEKTHTRLMLIESLHAGKGILKKAMPHETWIALQDRNTRKDALKNGPIEQQILQADIDVQLAYAAAHENIIKNLSLKK